MEPEQKQGDMSWSEQFYAWLRRIFSRRGLVLLIVTIALFLDNMLLTTVGELFEFINIVNL